MTDEFDRTVPPSSHSSGGQALDDDESGLTSFLAPAESKDEIGRLGGFRIQKILGHGGMGVVFQGEDARLGRKVAIKAMLPHLAGSPAARKRFLLEARAAAALEHDHIVPIFHVDEDRGSTFIVMPLLQGEPLDRRLDRQPKLPIAEVLRIGREAAEGLSAAHRRGMIHRDIKPANIWIETPHAHASQAGERGGRVKILDFGLVRPTTEGAGLTQQGALLGTPAYMAPEQARQATVDARCDLWSLGVVLYRACTGTMPFRGGDAVATLMDVATGNPAPPIQINTEVPPALSALIMQLLEKEPQRRPASAQEVAEKLGHLEADWGRKHPGATRTQSDRSGKDTAHREKRLSDVADANAVPSRRRKADAAIAELTNAESGSSRVGAAKSATAMIAPPARRKRGLLLAVAVVVALVVVASLLVFVPWAGIFRANTSSDSADRASLTNSSSEDASGKSSSAGSSQGSATAVGPNQIVMDLGKGVTMKLVRIPAQGKTFWMGTSLGDGKPEEKPQHEVEFSHDYWLGEFVVTQAQFKLFDLPRYAKSKPTRHFSADGAGAAAIKDVKDPDQLPADSVNWFEARDYCAELTKRFKAELGFEFRLPTEAEWEYACRAGDNRKDTSDYYLKSGPTRTKPLGTVNTKQSNLMRTSVQGEFPESVNAFGLWDMHGNVVQWCQDYFDVDFYKHSPRVDPVCEAAGARLVMRGSSWQDDDCRASDRHARGLLPDYGDPWKGFRVCAVRVDK